MAVGLIFDSPGVTQAQCDQVRADVLPGDQLAPGMLSYAAGPTDTGWCVVTVWESHEAMRSFFAAKLGPALQRAGITVQPRIFQVVTALGYGAGIGADGTPMSSEQRSNRIRMAASIVEYTVKPEHADELHSRIRTHLVPAARQTTGYRGLLLLDRGADKRLAVLLYDAEEDVRAAQEALTPVGREHTYALMSGPALGSVGTVVIHDQVFAGPAQPAHQEERAVPAASSLVNRD